MARSLKDWILDHAQKPGAVWLLAGVAFAESSFFPLPPDILLIPQILARRERAWWLATVATVSSVVGGFLGYAIGYWLFDTVGVWIVTHLGSMAGFERAKASFDVWGFWLIVGKGATPIPYKIVTILCGVMHYDLGKFALASVIARGMRFYLEAALLYWFGAQAKEFIERRLMLTMVVLLVLLVGGFLLLRYI
jgi:membrane protein YqaA with SNARE-associated domain